MKGIIDKLVLQAGTDGQGVVESIIKNQIYNYIPLRHSKQLLNLIWELSKYIYTQSIIKFKYTRQDGKVKNRIVKPVAIMFSEFYFYLIAFKE